MVAIGTAAAKFTRDDSRGTLSEPPPGWVKDLLRHFYLNISDSACGQTHTRRHSLLGELPERTGGLL